MSKISSDDLVDIFKEEVTKKAKKDLKRKLKKEKELEKKENIEFEKIAKKANVLVNKKKEDKVEKEESVFAFLYDAFFGFFLILLLFTTCGFIYFYLSHNSGIKYIIQMGLFGVFVIFYCIAMTTRGTFLKKLASIISNAAICAFMIFTLYYL
jgi:hypothetical protein